MPSPNLLCQGHTGLIKPTSFPESLLSNFDTDLKFCVISFLTRLLLCHLDHLSYRGPATLYQEMNHQDMVQAH